MQSACRLISGLALALGLLVPRHSSSDVVINQTYSPGSPQEAAILLRNAGSSLAGTTRWAETGTSWTYRLVAPPTSRVSLQFGIADPARFTSTGKSSSVLDQPADSSMGNGRLVLKAYEPSGKAIPIHTQQGNQSLSIILTVPNSMPLGDGPRIKVGSVGGRVGITSLRVSVQLSDRNRDGVSDFAEGLLGVKPNQRPSAIARPKRPQSSFQTAAPYAPEIAVPTDAVLVYSANEEIIRSWMDHGYSVQTMGGFRSGQEYIKEHPDEVQRDAQGNPISIEQSFYMVPTETRNENSKQYFATALAMGSTGICPEEPEIWARAGYSEAFKREWRARYGSEWVPPGSSVDARYRAEQLKGFLTVRQIESILSASEKSKPSAARMVALHSPVNYYNWGISVPHYSLLSLPSLQEIIGQVWTGTARTPARLSGVRAERTFEVGYLEYSSLYQLVRGTNKRLWFLMDPMEDVPNRSIQDYQSNYEQTLLASLLFPQVNSYEVMPWPDRIYGRVPLSYSTIVNNVVGALTEMWRHTENSIEAGSAGIATFVADSMAWQREQPTPSDFDGFYALTLPLVSHGVPIEVLQLDRVTEPGYLNRTKTILLSYDLMKPATPQINRAIADWVRRGGSLVLFGGTDPYDNVTDSWWQKAGHKSPLDALMSDLGVKSTRISAPPAVNLRTDMKSVLTAAGTAQNLENRGIQNIDLTEMARKSGSALVRFEDVSPADGWGAWLASAELRFGGRLAASFRTGSDIESRFLAEERGTGFSGEARFADWNSYWVYRFDNLPRDQTVTLSLDIGNGFLVKAGEAGSRPPEASTIDSSFDRSVQRLRLSSAYPVTLLAADPRSTSLYAQDGISAPLVWESQLGSGHLIHVGIPPAYFSSTAQSSRWLRAITKRAHEKARATYSERPYFAAKRGPYTAVRTLGARYTADGRFVNMLSPTLAVLENPEVPARGSAFWMDAGAFSGPPRILAVSGRLTCRFEVPNTTSFTVMAPHGTEGVARLYSGKRQIARVRGFTNLGTPVSVRAIGEAETVHLHYANNADGVIVQVEWK